MPFSDFFQIAIDGPVAAGKGTVSRLVADRLGFLYVDTGAMYRVAAKLAIENNCSLDDGPAIAEIISQAKIEMNNPKEGEKDGRLTTVVVNDKDVSWEIRTETVSKGASTIAVHPEVRSVLVQKQQKIASTQNVVMEGRDVTYRVLPEAQLKIFLTGDTTVRAKRRHLQLQTRGQDTSFSEVHQAIVDRDTHDTERATDPLKKIPEAWEIDTTDLSIEQVVDLIVNKVAVMRHQDGR